MNKDELKKLISEVVRKAVKEELREIIVEAVEIASRPEHSVSVEKKEVTSPESRVGVFGISEMLDRTAKTMTREDYRNVLGGGNVVESSPTVGDELPSFAKRAGEIFRASNKIKR